MPINWIYNVRTKEMPMLTPGFFGSWGRGVNGNWEFSLGHN